MPRPQPILPSAALRVLALGLVLGLAGTPRISAQVDREPDRPQSGRSSTGRDRGDRSRPRRPVPAARTPASGQPAGRPGIEPAKAADPNATKPAGDEAAAAGDSAAATSEDVGAFDRLRAWLREHSVMVLSVLGTLLVASVAWWLLAGSRSRRVRGESEDFLERLDDPADARGDSSLRPRYSSTRIRAEDVTARLGGGVAGRSVETDREYALVVDEEALRAGEVDESTGRAYAPDHEIRASIREHDFEMAWELYRNAIEADGELEFRPDIELVLSEHFLRERHFDRAAQVLEHHVATHSRKDVDPEVYFNLGYVHVLGRTYNKSRRFLRLFVESGANPQHVERAQNILAQLETR